MQISRLENVMWGMRIKGSDLAKRTGIATSVISNYKRKGVTTIAAAVKISEALGVTIQDIIGFKDTDVIERGPVSGIFKRTTQDLRDENGNEYFIKDGKKIIVGGR